MNSALMQFSVKKLYKDTLRAARGLKQLNPNIDKIIRGEFKRHMKETDPSKIEHQKEAAIRALSNFYCTAGQVQAHITSAKPKADFSSKPPGL